MRLIHEITKNKDIVLRSLNRYGFNPENNFYHYMYDQTASLRNVFVEFENDMGILAVQSRRNVWYVFPNGILAPEDKRLTLLLRFIRFALEKQQGKKVGVELIQDLKQKLSDHVKKTDEFALTRTNFILYWPIFDMKQWDHTLYGKQWKKIRNIVNKFENNGRKIKVIDSRKIEKDTLKRVVTNWIKSRNASDYVGKGYYFNLIDNGFKGFDHTRSVCLDGVPCTITAGWKIPNSENYYSAIGITDYSFDKDLGLYANLEDLRFLKRKGYRIVDFGGSDGNLLSFKKKFFPHKIYKTYTFSIKPKK